MEIIAEYGQIFIIIGCVVGFFMAWGIGANDVANATFLSIVKNRYGIFNLGSKMLHTIKEIANIVNKLSTKKSFIEIVKVKNKEMFKNKFNISINNANKKLGWKPKISLYKGLNLILKNKYN